jgi:plasmid stabilization system protein ParE
MSRIIVVRPQAEREISDAYDWYESQRTGLGNELKTHFQNCSARILERPERYPQVRGRIRRVKLEKFPFAIFYQIRRNEIVIHSFFHLKRNPSVWIRRLRGLR